MTPNDNRERNASQPPEHAEDRTLMVDRTLLASPPAPEMGNGLPVGTRLAEFEITRLLGEGGFGIVYLANDTSLHRRVALKEYMPSALAARLSGSIVQVKSERYRETFEAGRKSFVNEARLLAQFDHASLVKVYRFWEDNGTAYMVMPFYEGRTLRDTLRARTAPPDEAWLKALLLPLTEALQVIHAEQCYHRDIAPDNVMMLASSQRPLLLDFGAARRVIGDMTQALTVILKPGYAPVEQYAEIPGMRQGPWTDVYALAAVVYYAVTGRTPPPSVGRLLNDTFVPLAKVAAGRYSDSFLQAVDRALAVRPEARTQDIAQLREEMGLVPSGMIDLGVTLQLPLDDEPAGPATGMSSPVTAFPPTAMAPATPPATPAFMPTQLAARGLAEERTMRVPPPPSAPPGRASAGDEARTQWQPRPIEPVAVPGSAPTLLMPRADAGQAAAARADELAPMIAPLVAPVPAPAAGRSGLSTAMVAAGVVLAGLLGFGIYQFTRSGQAPTASAAVKPASPEPTSVAPSTPAPVAAAPFEVEREFDRVVQGQSPGFAITAETPKTDLQVGKDEYRFSVKSEREGWLYVFGWGPDHQLTQLVPNDKSGPVRLKRGQPWRFPAPDRFAILADKPLGPSQFLMLVSNQARNFDSLQPRHEDLVTIFPITRQTQDLAQKYSGPGSVLIGRPNCPPGSDCADDYGAAVLRFNVVP
jgi:serine/threonine protein kinase